MTNSPENIAIAGAGLVGSLLSILLAKKGHNVSIYERRPDMRKNTMGGGRSINLALSERGWEALERAGVAEEVRKEAIPMTGRLMHGIDGTTTYQPYGLNDQAIYSVSRGGLNALLMNLAEREGVSIHFNAKVNHVDLDQAAMTVEHPDAGSREIISDRLIGTDGAFSVVRQVMMKTDRFNYQQEYIEHGYKELTIPPMADGSHAIEKNVLHIWPRGSYMLIALPNPDGSFTCTLFFPFEGDPSFSSLQTEADVLGFFNEVFPDVVPLIPDLTESYFTNPTSSLVIIRCFPWAWKDKVCLMGDASHAIVPFYGQGMNSGFEDCRVFDDLLMASDNWLDLFQNFERERKPNADAIADLAMRNFVEMRDLTADPEFLLRKKIEARIQQRHPEKWTPLYSMVTFSHIPYHDALMLGKKHDAIMRDVMQMQDIENRWDSPEVEAAILAKL
jgi:kynurenine 3-monooxygenase